jgi:hypothetical protein
VEDVDGLGATWRPLLRFAPITSEGRAGVAAAELMGAVGQGVVVVVKETSANVLVTLDTC